MATRSERRDAQDLQRQRKALERMDPTVATNFLLVRHGETDWNAEKRLQGHRDVQLNALGRKQAAEIAAVLEGEHFDALYSSDLKRAVQTAEAIAANRPGEVKVHRTAQLRERSLGVVEGLTLPDVAAQHPEAFQLLRRGDDDVALPGGESPGQLVDRVVAEVERIASQHPGQTVLIVAHGGVLHAAYKHASGHSYNGSITNASLHRIRVQGSVWAVVQWNITRPASQSEAFGGGLGEG